MIRVICDIVVTVWRLLFAVRDLAVLVGPQVRRQRSERIAFLVHDRDGEDAYRWFPAMKYLPLRWQTALRWRLWPVVLGTITTEFTGMSGRPVRGWLIGIAPTAGQMVASKEAVRHSIAKFRSAMQLASRMGVANVGLGAYTASLTRLGERLEGFPAKPTTGHALTSAAVCMNAERALERCGKDVRRARVAILGAGSIGETCGHLLAGRVGSVVVVDINHRRAQNLASALQQAGQQNASCSTEMSAIRGADLVIAATTAPDAIIRKEHLKNGVIVVDDSQPRNLSREEAERAGAIVVDGGIVSHPGIDCSFDMGLYSSHDVFGCLGEVLLVAVGGPGVKNTVGKPDLDVVKALALVADDNGFEWTLRSFNRPFELAGPSRITTTGKTDPSTHALVVNGAP